jgi:D-alanyl-D-alanine carboxypeptidase
MARRRRSTLVALVAVLGLAALAPSAPAASPPSRAKADAALDAALARVVRAADGPPGVAALVQRGSGRRFLTRGVASLRTGRRFRPSDHLRTASTGKAMMGAAALRLVDAAALSLDDTVGELLPGLPAAWGEITLAQLLQHRSGLPEYTAAQGLIDALNTRPKAPVAPLQLVTWLGNAPLEFAPGTRYAYPNTDNIVAGLMIEAATGLSLRDELSQRVFDPLRMRNTSLPTGYRQPTPFVTGYDAPVKGKREDLSEVLNADYLWAAGGEVTTQDDFTRFVRAYAGPRYLKAPTRAAQRRWVRGGSEPPGPGRNDAGLALFRYTARCGVVYGHTGNLFGYSQFIAATADGTRSIVVSANTQLSPDVLPKTFKLLRSAFEAGVCAALAR